LTGADSILVAGALLTVAIFVSLLARRLRVPGLVVFLAIGMVAGPHGLDVVDFATPEFGQIVGVIALSLILFEGGLAAGWKTIKPVFGTGVSLAVVGTLLTAVITGLGAAWLIGLGTVEGLLLGSIVAATDGAAVFALLRRSSLRRRLAYTLEAEAGFNDPIAVLLVLGFIEWIQLPDFGLVDMLELFVVELGVGAAVGLIVGRVAAVGLERVGLIAPGLYPVGSLAAVAVAFGLAEVLEGSGFLAVYLAGLTLGSAALPNRRSITDFHDGLAWVSQIAIFLVLGLLVVPDSLGSLWDEALIVTLLLMFAARPVAVVVATLFSKFQWREIVLLQWAGLRGAVPIVMATFPVIEGVSGANATFNIVFFVVIASSLLQGTTFEWAARRLNLTTNVRAIEPPLIQVGNIRRLGAEVFEFPVREGDAIVGHVVNDLQLPREALVSVIVRGDEALLPRGSTDIEAGDRLHILVRGKFSHRVEAQFDRWREGPVGEEFAAYVTPISGRSPIFTVRPWQARDGDPGDPDTVMGIAVSRRLRTRRDEAGALLVLADGRFAVSGEGIVAVGGPGHLLTFCSQRIRRTQTRQARAWWQEVAGAVAHASTASV
jgi:cell volume regulation protein A